MSVWVRMLRGAGRVVAVYRINKKTYVEVKPSTDEVWEAIQKKIEHLNAIPVLTK
jgi:hypothetical protein